MLRFVLFCLAKNGNWFDRFEVVLLGGLLI